MTVDDIKSYFKTVRKASEAIGVTTQCFHLWKKKGVVPRCAQLEYQLLTNGALKADAVKRRD